MFVRAFTIGVAAVILAAPVTAQERGTMELGAYVARNSYDDNLGLNSSWGGGARVGMFFTPRFSFEFEAGLANASRPLGLQDVNVANTYARLTLIPVKAGRLSFLLGAGLEHTDTYYYESYGPHVLLGAKYALNEGKSALRLDWIYSDLEGGLGTNTSLHMGVSLYRNPAGKETTVIREVPGPMPMQHSDSVSAAETRRLRAAEAAYRTLRDSLNRPFYGLVSSAEELAIMLQKIYFEREKWDLSDSAKTILDRKVPIFQNNPAMRIIIIGYASLPGTDEYNMALGLKRARAAREYLFTKGITPERIEITTRGETRPTLSGDSEHANAENRRAHFRLLNADAFLDRPDN